MGCGKSAWDDDIQQEIYQRKIECINGFSPTKLITKLDKIKELSEKVNKETSSGSRYLFRLIDDLVKATDWERWE